MYNIIFKSKEDIWVCKSWYLSRRGSCLTSVCVSECPCSCSPHALPLLCLSFCCKAESSDCLWAHGAAGSGCLVAHRPEWSTDVCVHGLILFARSLKLGITSWGLFLTFKKIHQPSGFGY